ncbi:hypothetical protein F5Y13DRAFT_4710 [Hypoxylon sp. FL1857]|nr:hypothetical protein F5Y13DRAFT_4710 [Hypoxylon sp. FL1857]
MYAMYNQRPLTPSTPSLATHCPNDFNTLSRSVSRSQLTTFRKTSGLQRLPYEIMAYIVNYLDVDEIFDLSLCSRDFQYLVREERFCKAVITAKASYTVEAQEAQQSGHFSRALRRVAKRRQALSQASPYVIGIVGLADSYEYIHGILCYIVEARPKRWLRILNLHASASHEVVIDIPSLIREAVPRSAKSRKYKFRVLYHASGITSCLFSFALPNTENWLLIFKADEQDIVAKIRLESTAKIFVRNNKEFLYFGTHSEEGADGFRNWVLTGFSISDRSWFPRKMHLADVVGYDVGSTVCFEIIDNHFYGLSNQTDFEIRETDWVSYYHCFRFPLRDPDPKNKQIMKRDDSWRRQHAEGPIDDRWGFLKLEKDEASGAINIIESRKEWLAGKSGSRRTYYTTEVLFDEDPEVDGDNEPPTADGGPIYGRSSRPIAHLDKPTNRLERFRSPNNVHPGDDSSITPMFTRSQTHLRSYQRCSSTYLDLVDDSSSGTTGSRRLRLRTGHRKSKAILFPGGVPPGLEPDEQIKQLYRPNEIYFWPPEQDPLNSNPFLNKIYEILNPPGYLGSVTASSDERSLVYATGEDTNGLKVLVYVSFDPAARLAGMLREEYVLGEQTTSSMRGETIDIGGYNSKVDTTRTSLRSEDVTSEAKGKDNATGELSRHTLPSYISDSPLVHTAILPPPEGCNPWAWVEKAMHRDLAGKNYTFAH